MRVTAGFSRLPHLDGVRVHGVVFDQSRVIVAVALSRWRLVCPLGGYAPGTGTTSSKSSRAGGT